MSKKTDELFENLASQESDFLKSEIFSPCMRGKPIRVKISGIIMTMKVDRPKNYEGWGVFKPTDPKHCRLVRDANLQERSRYLELFPAVRMILCVHRDNRWFGHPGQMADSRFKFTGLLPVTLPIEPQLFKMIVARFDGASFWFEKEDSVHDPKISQQLRERLNDLGEPKSFNIPGLTSEERAAYLMAYAHELENRKDRKEEKIKEALRRGGAQYRSYVERGNSYTIEYTVDGQTHRSTVNKDTLAVESAGICLTDHHTGRVGDKDFDLQSLVGVIREGQGSRQIYRR